MSASSAYQVLDIMPDCTLSYLKAAFRAKVKQFHPDVKKSDDDNSNTMIRRVIQAYEGRSSIWRFGMVTCNSARSCHCRLYAWTCFIQNSCWNWRRSIAFSRHRFDRKANSIGRAVTGCVICIRWSKC